MTSLVGSRTLLQALEGVRDPELDEPITTLGFVASASLSEDGDASVHLRLPTYFCAPNFAYLMVADAYDAVSTVDGVRRTEVVLDDHFAADAINDGVAARAGFVGSFDGEAVDELDGLRADFLRKAVMAGTDQVCRPLVSAGLGPGGAGVTDAGRRPAVTGAGPVAPPAGRARAARRRRRPAARRAALRRAGRAGRGAAAPAQGPADPHQPGRQHRHLPRHAAAPLHHRRRRRGPAMKAVRLHAYHELPVVEEVPEPTVTGPFDVLVRVGGAGVCRTDLHIVEGQWAEAMAPPLPYTLGHENAGWVAEVGSAVSSVAVGDTVILHPTPTCGLCRACRAGNDMHCVNSSFPGLSGDGGMAELPADLGAGVRQARPRPPSRRTSPRWPTPGSPPTTRSARRCRCCTRAPRRS